MEVENTAKRRRGRPKGSKNKPKLKVIIVSFRKGKQNKEKEYVTLSHSMEEALDGLSKKVGRNIRKLDHSVKEIRRDNEEDNQKWVKSLKKLFRKLNEPVH